MQRNDSSFAPETLLIDSCLPLPSEPKMTQGNTRNARQTQARRGGCRERAVGRNRPRVRRTQVEARGRAGGGRKGGERGGGGPTLGRAAAGEGVEKARGRAAGDLRWSHHTHTWAPLARMKRRPPSMYTILKPSDTNCKSHCTPTMIFPMRASNTLPPARRWEQPISRRSNGSP